MANKQLEDMPALHRLLRAQAPVRPQDPRQVPARPRSAGPTPAVPNLAYFRDQDRYGRQAATAPHRQRSLRPITPAASPAHGNQSPLRPAVSVKRNAKGRTKSTSEDTEEEDVLNASRGSWRNQLMEVIRSRSQSAHSSVRSPSKEASKSQSSSPGKKKKKNK